MIRFPSWRAAAAAAAAGMLAVTLTGPALAAGGQPAGQPVTPSANLRVHQRHAGQLRRVPSTTIPRTHLAGRLASRAAGRNSTAVSENWSGYADQACGTCAFRYVAADFTVPALNCSNAGGTAGTFYESQWAGLDGWTSQTVEQAGVAGFCDAGTPAYYAWYEMYPLLPVVFAMQGQAGDNIAVNVFFNAGTGKWQLTLSDTTQGMGFATAQACGGTSCRNSSAEVISEDPGGAVPGGINLADYGQANFNNATVTTRNVTHGNLAASSPSYYTSFAVTMTDPGNGAVMAVPGPLRNGTAGGIPVSDFEDFWKASS
jgi:hypothetical protein